MRSDKFKFITSALGIFVCYFYFGILHEKITRGFYGDKLNEDGSKGERFEFPLTLVGMQIGFNWMFARVLLCVHKQPKDKTYFLYYACGALTSLLSAFFTNLALRWVNYPTQIVAKAAKPIPVMILSVILGGRSYPKEKYIFVSMIVVGVILFMYKDGEINEKLENETFGELLVLMSLFMDGLSAAVQERMRAKYAPTGQHMMLNINTWSSLLVSLSLYTSGEPTKFREFAMKHPEVLTHMASLGLAGALGQLFIFRMISSFGSLSNSLVTTTRKFFTVLFSVLFFGNNLSEKQWLGTVMVFSGLFADMLHKKVPSTTKVNKV